VFESTVRRIERHLRRRGLLGIDEDAAPRRVVDEWTALVLPTLPHSIEDFERSVKDIRVFLSERGRVVRRQLGRTGTRLGDREPQADGPSKPVRPRTSRE